MVHIFVVWDRIPESELFQTISEGDGLIQMNSLSAENFLQHPDIPDSCDAVLLIGTVADNSFYATAQVIREQCRNCPLILSTTAEGMDSATETKTKTLPSDWKQWADLWIVRKGDDDAETEVFGQKLLLIISRMQGECGELFSKFKTIADHANYGIAISDLTGNILYVNQWFANLHGYQENDLLGKSLSVLHSPEQLNVVNPLLDELRKTGHFENEEVWHQRKDGSVFPTRMSAVLISDVNGEPLYLSTTLRDITKEKAAEEEILKFRTIAENANYGIVITDPEANIIYGNDWFAAMYGYSREELTGKNIDDLYRFQSVEFANIKQRLFEQNHLELEELNATRKDGSIFPTRANIQILSDNDGTPLFVSGIVVDITEQKKAAQELEIARYSVENATDEVYWILRDGQFFNVNKEACRMLGYTKDELCALSVFDIDPDFTRGDWETHWQNIRETKSVHIESRHRTKDGSIYPVEISANYLKYGDFEFNCAFARDITARKQAEEDLQRSEEQLRLKLDSILSPDYIVEEVEFSNIIDSEAIQSLMDEFYKLTNIGIAVSDMKGNILVATGWQDICTKFHRVNPETQKNCLESDVILATGVSPGEIRYYKCKNNMWDTVTPIYIGGKHMGNLYLGQFFYDDEEVDTSVFAEQADRYGFDKEAYLAALDRVPRWSHERVKTAMVFYQKFARMIADLSYSNLKLAKLVEEHKKTEEQLKFSEQKYRSYIDNSPEGVFVTDANGNYLEVNQAACNLLGYTEDELLAMNITQTVSPENTEKAREHFRGLQERGRVNGEMVLLKKDGTPCTVNLGAVVLPNGTSLGFTTDLTEIKQAEERIIHLNRLLGAIRNVNQLIVQEKDPQTLIEKTCTVLTGVGGYNSVWIALFDQDGKTRSVAKSALADAFSPMYEYLMDSNLCVCAKKAIATHTVVVTTDPLKTCDCPLAGQYEESGGLTKSLESNGTVYGIISASVFRDLALDTEEQELFSEVAGDLGFALYSIELEEKRQKAEEDILEKNRNLKAAYRELEESERHLSQIIEFLPDATFAIDMQGRVISWNKAMETMTGVPASEILGKGDYEYSFRVYGYRRPVLIDYLLHKELRDTIDYSAWYEEGNTLVAENFVQHLYDNKGAYVWFTACRLFDSQGNVTGAIESIRDVTSMKEAEQQILKTTHDLEERVKELTCLRDTSDILLQKPPVEELFQRILSVIQAAMEYPEDAGVAVQTEGHRYQSDGFQDDGPEIHQTILADTRAVGTITVRYRNDDPEEDERSFLPEEMSLLRIISERVGNYLSRRSIEIRLRDSEEKFRELFNNMSSGVAVYEVVGDGNDFIFSDFNKASEEMDQVRREDVIGKSIFEVFPGVEDFGLPAVLRRVYKTGKPEHFPLTEYKDEKIHGWRENYVYRLPSGEIVAVYDDVTEKKQAVEALTENEYKYHEIFNNINEAVFLHEIMSDNTRGHFVEVNDIACERLGYSRDELLKKAPADINTAPVRKDDPSRVMELKTGTSISFDAEHVRKDGSVFPVHVNARMIELRGHHYILSLVRDLTEERAAKEREAAALQQIEENLTQLAILNDEIRNPLAVISGIIGFSEEEIANPVLEQVEVIDTIVNRLDQGWLESEKIREYLRKHHDIA